MEKRKIVVIGSGPAALMLAAHLDETKFDIHIYEKNNAAGRKFLVAGDGGFNLTHSEDIETFITRYTPQYFLKDALLKFTNEDLRKWLRSIGIETFVGSSKRVFPIEGIKPIDVLNAILAVLKKKNVHFHFQHEWCGWKDGKLLFKTPTEQLMTDTDNCIFSLGGGSWKVTGSEGGWTKYFAEKKIGIIPFQPSNCVMNVTWPANFISQHEGKVLKNISVKCGDAEKKGELVITKSGLEGGAIYFHSPAIRKQLNENKNALINIDLRPDSTLEEICKKIKNGGKENRTTFLRSELNLDNTQVAFLKSALSKEEFLSDEKLSTTIKNVQVTITGLAPIDEAISTVGGIALEEINENFELKKLPHHFVIGEMLDWDAPTGGYLLQGCFSMGVAVAHFINSNS
ncbi:MAG TPA: TIGR03862 family flavoprotein [Bacteroidia bacterium]|jgi:uncharacterized flavoprotein (TIGR03862 family)|nr:TIGR03862 family flavoprotein [Bacteroidia bacterium]